MEFFFLFFFFSAHPHGAGFTNPIAGLGILPVWNNVRICTGGGDGRAGCGSGGGGVWWGI